MSDPSQQKANDIDIASLFAVERAAQKFDAPYLLQFHWQNLRNLQETIFVAQGSFTDTEAAHKWIEETIEKHKDSYPGDGWCSLICTEDAECFVRAAKPIEADESVVRDKKPLSYLGDVAGLGCDPSTR